MRQSKIHKADSADWTACGIMYPVLRKATVNGSSNWKHVTCKNCLKMRGKKK